jgi:hypothetical protein
VVVAVVRASADILAVVAVQAVCRPALLPCLLEPIPSQWAVVVVVVQLPAMQEWDIMVNTVL